MKNKSVISFLIIAIFAIGINVLGWVYMNDYVGAAELTEETILGNRNSADGLEVSFQSQSSGELLWTNTYDYSSNTGKSDFVRERLPEEDSANLYDEFNFTGRSESSNEYYTIGFHLHLGNKTMDSDDLMAALKYYEDNDGLTDGNLDNYIEDIELLEKLNEWFKIPVLKTDDYYEFNPLIAVQEENVLDGKKWVHPDFSGGLVYNENDSTYGKTASEYSLKNRMLFVVNTKTANGDNIDVSHIQDGYGIYELPIEVAATATVKYGQKSRLLPNPKPLTEELAMIYPLDENAEYIEISLSPDHRHVAVFYLKDGKTFVEMIDADNWVSGEPIEAFSESDNISYTWGTDGTLVLTNHKDEVAVILKDEKAGDEESAFTLLYRGNIKNNFDDTFFGMPTEQRKQDYRGKKCSKDKGLSVESRGDKVALIQSLPTAVAVQQSKSRDVGVNCAIIDKTGLCYLGTVKSNIVDDVEVMVTPEKIITPIPEKNIVKWNEPPLI